MTEYAEGQVVKGKQPPTECPDGFYWRKLMGQDAFKLYLRKERKAGTTDGDTAGSRMTIPRVAEGVRFYMQNEEGFKRVVEAASLSVKALQNLSTWANAVATEKAEKEKVRSTALAKANAALKDAGLMIGPDGTVQPIPVV
jgi:hypothetical protein